MEKAEFEELFRGVDLPEKVRRRLVAVHDKSEGDVETRWVHRLICHYMYSPHQIGVQVPAGAGVKAYKSSVFADIVVYRDRKHLEPFIVIEVKKENMDSFQGEKQSESYARNLGAEYHVWSDWLSAKFFKTARYIDQSTQVGNIPSWVEGKSFENFLSKDHVLPPFKDEEHLRHIVKQCHDNIFFNLGHDPAKSFDELMKVLFLKMYDERVTPNYYHFTILPNETEKEVGNRMREMFAEAVKSARYSDVFTTALSDIKGNVYLDLDDPTIYYIVQCFQSYSLINTTSTLEGVDIKGTVFEKMVGSTFRGELGAYFTPRELVEFCVRMLDPTINDVILDPACGSGGFLIMVIKHIKDALRKNSPNLNEAELHLAVRDFCEKSLFGVDINERMVRVTKMNMIMHGDGHSGIHNCHGLGIGIIEPPPIREGQITKIFSNPPFAGRENNPKYLQRFETAKSESGTLLNPNKTIPFVEMIINLLAPGGTAALVLPNGVFNSKASVFKKLRDVILRETTITAIIGLPHWVFFHTGCDVQGSLLFIKKKVPPKDYKVFISWAKNVGYDAKGSKHNENDLPQILEAFKKRSPSNLFNISLLKQNDRLDPLYYQPGQYRAYFEGFSARTLGDVAEISNERVSKSKNNFQTYDYLEVNNVDKENGKILSLASHRGCDLPQRAKYIARKGMVLFPNARNSIKAGRAPVLITDEYDGIVVTSRFIPLRRKVPSSFVHHLLNLDVVKEELLTKVSGSSSGELKWEKMKELPIPEPQDGDYDKFMTDIGNIEAQIESQELLLQEKKAEINQKFEGLFSLNIEPTEIKVGKDATHEKK